MGWNVDIHYVAVADVRTVAQQQRGVLNDLAEIELGHCELLWTRIGEEGSNRLVQAVRLAEHDVHELRLVFAERQLLTEHLDRTGHRRQWIADFVGDARSHLAYGHEPLLQAGVALETPDIGHVLEREQIPGPAVWKRQGRRRQADVQEAAVAGPELDVRPQAPRHTERGELRAKRRWQLHHFARVATDCLLRRDRRDDRRGAVEGEDLQFGVGRHDPAQQAVDHVLVERAQVFDLVRRVLEARAGLSKAFRQRPR